MKSITPIISPFDAIFKYLEELRSNNNREWFNEHKTEYTVLRKQFETIVQEIIIQISRIDKNIVGVEPKDCIYRIYRDVRFSKDKTPYSTHFSAWITKGGKKSGLPGYYFRLEPGNSMMGAGIWFSDNATLKAARKEMFNNYEELKLIIHDKAFIKNFDKIEGDSLKNIPSGYPQDFPEPYILKLKEYFADKNLADDFFDENWMENIMKLYSSIYPYNDLLESIMKDVYGNY